LVSLLKLLITGGTGLLGRALIEAFKKSSIICATYSGKYEVIDESDVHYMNMNIQNTEGYARIFEDFRPDVVIHTASIGSPDFAEKNKKITWDINMGGTETIISLCEGHGAKYIYISSNGIYDGANAPYGEEDEAKPINYYGEIKLKGETLVDGKRITSAIIRPNILYGWHHPAERSNIVTMAIERLRNGETFMAFSNVYVMPLYVGQCAEAIKRVVDESHWGTYNIAGRDRVSIFELIRTTAEVFGLDAGLVKPVGHDYFEEMVPRPKDTSYKTKKMEHELMLIPLGIVDGLSKMKETEKASDGKS